MGLEQNEPPSKWHSLKKPWVILSVVVAMMLLMIWLYVAVIPSVWIPTIDKVIMNLGALGTVAAVFVGLLSWRSSKDSDKQKSAKSESAVTKPGPPPKQPPVAGQLAKKEKASHLPKSQTKRVPASTGTSHPSDLSMGESGVESESLTLFLRSRASTVLSYLALRKMVGIISFSLPFVLIFGKMLLDGPGLLPTISDYYHSAMRDFWVGGLCIIGTMLIFYRFTILDDILGDIAGISAIGVALVPNTPDPSNTGLLGNLGWLHFIYTFCFLVTMACYALFTFPKSDDNAAPTPRKLQKNFVYRSCGNLILVCLLIIFLLAYLPVASSLEAFHPYLWLESIIFLAFGIAWFVKGTE